MRASVRFPSTNLKEVSCRIRMELLYANLMLNLHTNNTPCHHKTLNYSSLTAVNDSDFDE